MSDFDYGNLIVVVPVVVVDKRGIEGRPRPGELSAMDAAGVHLESFVSRSVERWPWLEEGRGW